MRYKNDNIGKRNNVNTRKHINVITHTLITLVR